MRMVRVRCRRTGPRQWERAIALPDAHEWSSCRAAVHCRADDVVRRGRVVYRLCLNSNWFWLACPEGDDAAHRIVGRDAHGDAIPRDYFDTEAAHAAAELCEHFVAGITLDAVQPAAVHRDHGALHVDEIVLAQSASVPFSKNHYATAQLQRSYG